MRLIESAGTPRQIDESTGEALREEIAANLELTPRDDGAEFAGRLPGFVAALERHLPHVLEEMRATARGAGVDETDILRLNLPLCPSPLDRPQGGGRQPST